MLRVTLALLGAGPPPKLTPFSGSAKQRGGSIIVPGDPADVGAVGTHFWGPSVASLLWGWIQALPRALRQTWLGQGGRFASILGGFGWGGTGQGTQDMEERPAAGSTMEMGFSDCVVLCQHKTPAVSKHPDISSRAS